VSARAPGRGRDGSAGTGRGAGKSRGPGKGRGPGAAAGGGRSPGACADLAAGDFSEWLRGLRAALAQGGDAVVPCGDCRACCTSSYFIHVGPDERDTLEHLPAELLFEAPGAPTGHRVMGYDRRGHCPMFAEGECSVYAHRPRTCRTYDCRVFAATGIEPDRPAIAARARRWVFGYPSEQDRADRDAARDAAAFLGEHGECFSGGRVPDAPSVVAVAAVEVCDLFVGLAGDRHAERERPSEAELVSAVIAAGEAAGGCK
jgi:Fe-S-cluster containining protein